MNKMVVVPNSAYVLELKNLTKVYGQTRALNGVSFSASPGQIVGLVGPNGSGKSTLIRIVTGLTEATSGEVSIAGFPAGARDARRLVALAPDNPSGFDQLTIREFAQLLSVLYEHPPRFWDRFNSLLSAFELDRVPASVSLGGLSNGMRRQVAISAAIAGARHLLVIDEATAALDLEAVITLRVALKLGARSGLTILFASQDLHFAETLADRLVLLVRGNAQAIGTLNELRTAYGVAGDGSLETVFVRAAGYRRDNEQLYQAFSDG